MKPLILGKIGKLSRKDNSLYFSYIKNGDKKSNKIPIENTPEIYAYGEIEVNSKALSLLSKMEIPVHFFGYYGNYTGSFYPKERYLSGKLHIEQVKAVEDGRGFEIAKAIVGGIGEAVLNTFRDFQKNGKDLKEFQKPVRKAIEKLQKVDGKKQLLQIEASIWQNFYGSLDTLLHKDFVFEKRTKKPPENPLNALISFGKSIIYSKTVTALYGTQLMQSVSYLHEPSERRFSLSLDLSEVFHILIVFKAIFRAVNLKKLKVDKHFRLDLNFAYLNDKGKEIFVGEIEALLKESFEHKKLKRPVRYGELFRLEGYKLEKFLLGESSEFRPFSELEKS